MRDFLAAMAASSERRARRARSGMPVRELRRRIADRPPAPELCLHPEGFDLIAEVKRRSPSEGSLTELDVVRRAIAYANAGAAAVSVLTEPDQFGGSLEDLERISGALGSGDPAGCPAAERPTMRKDFITDPYQLLEARALGAGGVLVILRMLDDERLHEILTAAEETGLFVLLEAFDSADLERSCSAVERTRDLGVRALVGLNSRNLESLAVEPQRLQRLAGGFPVGVPRVAESGLLGAEDAARAAACGYDLCLVGTALMKDRDPAAGVESMLMAGRAARALSSIGMYGGNGTFSVVEYAPGV